MYTIYKIYLKKGTQIYQSLKQLFLFSAPQWRLIQTKKKPYRLNFPPSSVFFAQKSIKVLKISQNAIGERHWFMLKPEGLWQVVEVDF